MKCLKLTLVGLTLVLVALTATADSFRERTLPVKPDQASIGPGYDRRHVEVKFLDGLDIGLSAQKTPFDRLNQVLRTAEAQAMLAGFEAAGADWKRMSAIEESEIDVFRSKAEGNLNRAIADLNNYFILSVPEGVQTEDWIDQLNALDEVEIALAVPLPTPAPLPPDYQASQGYLGNAPTGIGAATAWGQPGGTGWGSYGPVRICDFEYSWNLNHQDFAFVNLSYNPSYTPSDPFADDNHGTAVVGELVSLNDALGTTGGVYAAQTWVSPTFLTGAWQLGVAMTWMLSAFGPGDVFLIEQQMQGPNYTGSPPGTQNGMVPIEWWASWYNIILTAVGNGIHVVEAAGNGAEDLDNPVYSTGNGGHWPFLAANNSGAIIVGAGAAPAAFGGSDNDRSRLWFSNYGSRVDLQGWGERVVTTGYGDLWAADGKNYWYTNTFSGTSSASPIVATAVAVLESIYEENNAGAPMNPPAMRSLLQSTGSPQTNGTYPVSQNIGPRPDLTAAIAGLSCCMVVGDVDHNGLGPDIADLVYLVNYMFSGGMAPPCIDEADIDGNGVGPDIADLVYLVNYMFSGGPAPAACP